MEVPAATHQAWSDIVTGKKAYTLKFLAVKILIARLTQSVSLDPSPDNVQASAAQLRELFVKNMAIPAVKEDLTTIFG
ncbi:MAG: hypothetical protein FWF01_00670 [Alphaproteobacteria bacterium]|nr:hypothetical protein [Alphaproteobacteria bacterium]